MSDGTHAVEPRVLPEPFRLPPDKGQTLALFLIANTGAAYPVRKGTKHAWVRLAVAYARDREAYPDLPGERVWHVQGAKAAQSPYLVANPVPERVLFDLLLGGFLIPRAGKETRRRAEGWLTLRHYLLAQTWMHVRCSENALASVVAVESGP